VARLREGARAPVVARGNVARMKWLKKALGQAGRERAERLVTDGFVHRHEGRLDQALAAYVEAVAADETLAVAHLNEGLARLDVLNRDARALDEDARQEAIVQIIACLDRALLLDDAQPVGWRALAHLEERRRAFGRVEDCWKKVLQHTPVDAKDGVKERTEAELKLKELAVKAQIDRARRRAVAASEVNAAEDEKKAALNELLPLIEKHGAEVERGRALAGALARRAHDPRARELLESAVREDPADVDALRDLAGVCLDGGDLKAALAHSMSAYRERPTDAALVCNVGVCHLGLADLDKAGEFIELSARLEPKDPIVVRAVSALKQARAAQK
jgi:tetratricopeptide (TPR) repeat protein